MDESSVCPHILIFPVPAQGHVRPMLKLAELLCLGGLQVTFLNSTYIHHRLLSHSGASLARFTRYSGFRFERYPMGLPMEHPRTADRIDEFFDALRTKTKPLFREKMISWCGHGESCETRSPVTCVLLDGGLGFSIDVTEEFGVPVIHFRCSSACSLWTYFSLNQLTEAGDFPFKDDDLDRLVSSLPEMEGFLRRRDLPSFFRTNDADDPFLQFCMKGIRRTTRTHDLILNTFEDLEGPVLSQLRNHYPKIYAVGPLHQHLKSRLPSETSTTSQSSSSLWEEDKSCIVWLDRQPSRYVVYVSFGSIAAMKKEEFMEFWYGLVNSGCHFLWVVRPDCSLAGEDGGAQAPEELLEGTEKRGLLVVWASQEEVLAHPAVGCFLTYSGWNSTC